MSRPSVQEIQAHPTFPTTIWKFKPTQKGKLAVGKDRGGPFNLYYEVHGMGKTKIVWIMGLGAIMSGWQRQTLKFGHQKGDQYSSLFFDNRGMGKSDTPVLRYSTSEMAKDCLELIDNLGWTDDRQLNIVGISMGGMIAQELALMIPHRVASLNLCSTAARVVNTLPYFENIKNRASMFLPKSLDRSIIDAANSMFPKEWLDRKDDSHPPPPGTPGVEMPDSGKYGMFSTNYERFAAQELTKRLNVIEFTKKGFMLAVIAAGWHHKSKEQLEKIADTVGRDRILVMHGTKDNMLTLPHGQTLIDELKPKRSYIVEGSGHVLMIEKTEWHDQVLEEHFKECAALENK